jgi:hypothetical protein
MRPDDLPPFTSADQDVLFKTLKANGFLLLYNLVESTMKNAIEAIFDEFKGRGVSFDSCRSEVRKIGTRPFWPCLFSLTGPV